MSMISEQIRELRKEALLSSEFGSRLLGRAADTIEMLSEKARESKWIPCEEKLPSDSREVLISCEWGIDIGQHEEDGWRSEWINHYDDDNVLAWMPLPQLYRADRKTEPQYHADVECNYKDCDNCGHKEYCPQSKTEPRTEPLQTCSVNGRPYSECSSCEHFRCTADEPQTERSNDAE